MPSRCDMEAQGVPLQTARTGRRAPPFMRWDQRGRPVLQASVKLIDGSTMRVMLDTDNWELAQERIRPLIVSAIAEGLLPGDSRPACLYGVYNRSDFWAEMSRLTALPEAQYDAERPVAEKRFDLPAWIIDRVAKRLPRPVSLASHRQRRFRARQRGEQTPMGTSWHQRVGRGKCFFINGRVMSARINVDTRVYQWSLGIDAADPALAQKRAARIMAPVQLAARGVRDAAAKVLDCSATTAAAAMARRALSCQKFADAILDAGGPRELADFVVGAPSTLSDAEAAPAKFLERLRSSGSEEEVSTTVPQRAAAGTAIRSSVVDPEKWLSILQRWRPRASHPLLITFINDLIEAAGPKRIERLDALIVHTDRTTRSAREKFDKLRRWSDAMRSDPWFWPQLSERDRPVSILVKKIIDESPCPLTRFEVERKFRRFRKVPSTGLAQELKELASRGDIDRLKLGRYWRQGTAAVPYESDAQRAYKLVYSAIDRRIREAELAMALGLSRKDSATLVSHLRKRGLFASATGNGVVVASADSLATLQKGPVFDGRGGIFFEAPERAASPDRAVFRALRAERPRVDREAQAQTISWLRTLEGEQLKIALAATAKESACDPADLEQRLSRSAQRYLRKERAGERWREKATRLMEQSPERSPMPLSDLSKQECKDGLTQRMFKDIIREVATALLEEKGLKTSWSAPGAPIRRQSSQNQKCSED